MADLDEADVNFCSSIFGCRRSWKWKRKVLISYLSQSIQKRQVI